MSTTGNQIGIHSQGLRNNLRGKKAAKVTQIPANRLLVINPGHSKSPRAVGSSRQAEAQPLGKATKSNAMLASSQALIRATGS
jgi:hypothetical protein